MKAGTTTLYRDLLTNPAVFMPKAKEPDSLCDEFIETERGLAAYGRLFRGARPDQICGEASTSYTKVPHRPQVAPRARKVLGRDLRVVYIVRDPIARIRSHHHHLLAIGKVPPSVDEAVRVNAQLIDVTRFAMQVKPWLDALGEDRVRIIKFEEFIRSRKDTIASLSTFLGIEARPDLVDEQRVYNKSDEKHVLTGVWKRLAGNSLYRRLVWPVMPDDLRSRIRATVLPPAPPKPDPPHPETIRFILDQLESDMDELARIMGRSTPLWPIHTAAH